MDDISKIENLKKCLLVFDSVYFFILEKLKNVCLFEIWLIICNELFLVFKYYKNVDCFYVVEDCYDLLWDYVKSIDRLIMVDWYFDILKNYCFK